MRAAGFPAHRVASSALFSLLSLLTIVLELADARLLALALGGSLLSLFLFTRAGVSRALGTFASPLAIVADLSLLFCALSLTGPVQSPFVLLLPAGVALAFRFEGRDAARFFAALSLPGVAALAVLGVASPLPTQQLFMLLAMGILPGALLVALEMSGREPSSRVAELAGTAPAPAAASPPAPPVSRDRQAEALHDLRSPLSVIRVYTDLIAEGVRRGELPDAEHLANLSREIELMERLVGGTAARGQPAPPPPAATADLVEILGSLATAYRLAHSGRMRIEFIAERPQLKVAADPVALQRAFRNVLDNAIKYTPEGGEVRIRAGAAGAHAFVVVKDTGAGMTPEERSRAFDYAFRGQGAIASGKPGKGLGLAVTKEILEANGGKISLSSEAGYGSEVTVLLPFQKGAHA